MTKPKINWEGMIAWPWLELARHATEAEKPEEETLAGNADIFAFSYLVFANVSFVLS